MIKRLAVKVTYMLTLIDEAPKESIILVHEDLIDNESFYETHELIEKLD